MAAETKDTPTDKRNKRFKHNQPHLPSTRDAGQPPDVFSGKIAGSYDAWYEQSDNRSLVELEKKALLEMVAPRKGETLLDVGCGTGYFSLYFRQKNLQKPIQKPECRPIHQLVMDHNSAISTGKSLG